MQPKTRSIDGFVKPSLPAPARRVPMQTVQPSRPNPLRPQLRPMPIPRPKKRPPLKTTPQQPAAAVQPAVATTESTAPQNLRPQAQHCTFDAPQELQPRRRWWQRLAFPLAILMCLCASFLVQSLPLGMGAIAVYAAVAWIKKLPSRYSFVMAFLSLATVVVLLVVRQNVDLASNFSTYTFLLLVVGIVSVMLESKTYPKKRNSKIPYLRRRKSL